MRLLLYISNCISKTHANIENRRQNEYVNRLVFCRLLDLRGNLGIVKEKPTRKTCFSHEKKRLAPHLPSKILPGGVSLKESESLLYFHEKMMLKRGESTFEKV